MSDKNLMPCPFCGGEAETDSRRAYRNLRTGALGEAVAVYCHECDADMNTCLADVPEVSREDLLADLVSRWNSRAREKRLVTALEEFVGHYPGGINPYLDAACSKARAELDAVKGDGDV